MSYNDELQSNNADLQAILNTVNELPEAGGGGADGFSPIATVTQTDDGAVIEITDKYGKTAATVTNGTDGKDGRDGSDASVTKTNITAALGYTPSDPGQYAVSVKALGATGDGSTDDTAIIQSALATYRKVYIPGGTYTLSGELVIRDNCQLELAQDVVLNFTQTSGNCITVNRSSWLRGNHATVFVPYAFTGHVVNVDTSVHTSQKDVPPWTHWDPQWKTARYLTDLNICKMDSYGLGRSTSGDSNGTAVYVTAVGSATSTFIWGMNLSGLRVAGAFEYGVRAVTTGSGYNHEMRVEAFMDAVKIGVSLEDCNNAYISATVQPRAAADGSVYAEHGIQLIRSKNTELLGSRVWDWNEKTSKWENGGIYQHIAMYGACEGTILNDFNYHSLPSYISEIRDIIYTDTASNFDSLIILQEPFTRWFKPVDGEPYFDNGDGAKRLVLKAEQDALFQTDYVPTFTDQLAKATDGNGAIFNEIGYKRGYMWEIDGVTLTSTPYILCTGFIPVKIGSVVRMKGMSFSTGSDYARVILFDSNFNKLVHVNRGLIVGGTSYHIGYEGTDDDCILTINAPSNVAYIKINVYLTSVGNNPIIAVDEEIAYTQKGFLADGIHVKEPNIIGMEKYERTGRMVTAISDASTDAQYPTAKAVYTALQDISKVFHTTTADITPFQVLMLIAEQNSVLIEHTDSTYGKMAFDYIAYSDAVQKLSASTIFELDGQLISAQLSGNLINNTWDFNAYYIARKTDIPAQTPQEMFAVSECVENQDSVCVIEETDASVSATDNSAYFDAEYIVVEKDTYKLGKEAMLALQGKKLTGNGSVAWNGWDTQPEGWKNSEDPTMLSEKLKVRYADDPVYLSMKLPGEANISSDKLVRPAMRASDSSGTYVTVNNIGATYAVDYTQLPDDVVICIGHLSVYTLSREKNAKWKLHTKGVIPTGQAMYYLPWTGSGDANVGISASKISVYDDHVRFALKRDDFAPSSSVSGSIAKCLHFWGEHKNLDLAGNLAVICFYETWTETPSAVGNLYTAIGCDQKSANKSKIAQNFWGRNVLLSTEKTVIAGHNISDAVYDQLRDTPNDPRMVFADYGTSFSSEYDSKTKIAEHNSSPTAHPDIRQEIDTYMADMQSRITAVSAVVQPVDVIIPSLNINDGVYEPGYFNADGADYIGSYNGQCFRNKNYIPVEGGRKIAFYYDAATWNNNNKGKAFYIVQYDANKNPITGREEFRPYVNSQSTCTLASNAAYVRVAYHNWGALNTDLADIKVAIYYLEDVRLEFIEYGFGSEAAYGVLGDSVCIVSPNGTKYALTVSDDGVLGVKRFGS